MNKEKKLKEAVDLADTLLKEHNLKDWSIETNQSRKFLALTYPYRQTISFSKYFILLADKEQFQGVALHEVAHALLAPNIEHDDKFLELCAAISPNALFACEETHVPIHKYKVTCPNCKYTDTLNKKRIFYCTRCSNDKDKVICETEINKISVVSW